MLCKINYNTHYIIFQTAKLQFFRIRIKLQKIYCKYKKNILLFIHNTWLIKFLFQYMQKFITCIDITFWSNPLPFKFLSKKKHVCFHDKYHKYLDFKNNHKRITLENIILKIFIIINLSFKFAFSFSTYLKQDTIFSKHHSTLLIYDIIIMSY